MTFFDVFPTPCQFWPGADRCDHEIFGVIYTYWNLGILRHFWSKKGVILAKMAKTPFLKGVILQRLFLFHGSWSFLKLASRNHQNDPFGPFWHFWPFLAILSICPGLSSSLIDPFSGLCIPEKAWKKGFSGGSKMTLFGLHLRSNVAVRVRAHAQPSDLILGGRHTGTRPWDLRLRVYNIRGYARDCPLPGFMWATMPRVALISKLGEKGVFGPFWPFCAFWPHRVILSRIPWGIH